MSTTKIFCATTTGIDASIITVEIDVRHRGMPAFILVGLPDASIREARERVIAAIRNSGYEFPMAKITVNLAPADLPKEGSEFDLAIAAGILAQEGAIAENKANTLFKDYLFIGELGLDGALRSVRGVLGVALQAKALGLKGLVLPKKNAQAAGFVEDLDVVGCDDLSQVIHWANGDLKLEPVKVDRGELLKRLSDLDVVNGEIPDLADVRGNSLAKKALEVAASGGHNMLMLGPPGVGKTLLARALPGILPPLSVDEALELTRIYSALGLVNGHHQGLVTTRPVRSPHHSSSDIALIGGGAKAQPGEITLAHHGILFLDEMTEFPKRVLEVLRQPLEDGVVSVSRAAAKYQYPARFVLLGAANPCPCGWWGSKDRECLCTPYQIMKYRLRLSGPLIDRIDLQVEVSAEEFRKELDGKKTVVACESSADVQRRVLKAREIQAERFKSTARINAHMRPSEIKKYCALETKVQEFLNSIVKKRNLSIRSFTKILKVSRTLADLSGNKNISFEDVSTAVSMRALDRTPTF